MAGPTTSSTTPSRGSAYEVKFFRSNDLDALRAAIGPKTRAVYAESIGNPKLDVADIAGLARVAHEAGMPLVIDNTVSPYLLRPIDHGVDIVVYSATKFIGGHGTSLGGLIVDSGKFDWTSGQVPADRRPGAELSRARLRGGTQADGEHRLHHQGPASRCCATSARRMSPFNAFLFLQGLETLHLRMPRHAENALAVAGMAGDATRWSPGSTTRACPRAARRSAWRRYLPKGAGAIIGFGIKGGLEAGKKFINSLELISHLANVGDAKTLAIHPASTTHQQLSAEEQLATGVTPDFIRLSIGIEHVDDILADIEQALEKSA